MRAKSSIEIVSEISWMTTGFGGSGATRAKSPPVAGKSLLAALASTLPSAGLAALSGLAAALGMASAAAAASGPGSSRVSICLGSVRDIKGLYGLILLAGGKGLP